jgi:DNA-binding HxlR family transcriptional regulator
VLREQLRQMLADDLIVREELSPRRLGVRYGVTRHGRSLRPVFAMLWRWGQSHPARAGADRGDDCDQPGSFDALMSRSRRRREGREEPR